MNVTWLPDLTPLYTAPNGQVFVWAGPLLNCTLPPCPVELSVYGYRASLPFSGLLIALYGLCAIAQIYLGLKHKRRGFMTTMLIGIFTEMLGYGGRIIMWQNPWNQTGFTMQIVLITIGPVFFSAAVYVMLSRIIKYISPKASRFPGRYYYNTFITCDLVALVLQAVGGGLSSTSHGTSQAGVDIALAGLSFQVATLVLYIVACADYAFRSRHVWRQSLTTRFKVFVGFLGLATLFILARCSYRVYELNEGYTHSNAGLRDQPLFIALEGV
ncbi:uncharacterized protein LTR77_010499 [Saxophila tyrrhenica]|uniref:Sphingoid long-chain base transporter RSB1 n=1 Tax=Saxophila tyrrhenica TaxID=1690608 RepID=A0AAV9NWP8_9PEZI|nr:hypothetical protein LTR77_010499 [Saxophila tyrrhenica]